MIGTSQLINAFGAPVCFTDTTDIFKDGSGVALYGLDYDASDAGGASGKFGEAAIFNGSSSFIEAEDSSSNTFGFANHTGSISAWVNIDSLSSENPILSKRDSGNPGNRQWYLRVLTSGAVEFELFNTDTASDNVNSTTTLNTNQWYHIVATLTTSNLKIYINGVEDVSESSTYSTIQNDGADLEIGRRGTNTGHAYFDGKIDQVRIFNTALTQSQVTQLSQENSSTVGTHLFGCIANYNLDGSAKESMGTTAYDGTETDITYRYDGTPTNVDFGVGGKSNYGARFNGSSSGIFISSTGTSVTDYDQDFSISCWFNFISLNASYSYNVLFTGGGTKNIQFLIDSTNGARFQFYDGTIYYVDTGAVSAGNWYHVVATRSKTAGLEIYLNGISKDTNSFTGNSSAINNKDSIGSYWDGTRNSFNGSIDQVRIFNKAISAAEVSKLYGNGAGEVACTYTSTTDNIALPITNTAYYKLDNNSKDSARSTGKFNEGAVFNGSSSEITVSSFASLTQVGISMWVNIPDVSAQAGLIARYVTNREFAIYMYGGTLAASLYYNGNNGNATQVTASTYMSNNTWHHIAYTANGSTAPKLYIDGSEVGTPQYTDAARCAYYTSSEPLDIGHFAGVAAYNYEGLIDQVRIYDVALSSLDVSNLYAETASDTSTLSFPSGQTAIATYQLDGNSTDLSGNYNGTDTNVTYAYDGTESNIEYRFGRFGQAAVFNGSSSYVDLGSTIIKQLPMSISLWLNPVTSSNATFYSNYDGSSVKGFYCRVQADGTFLVDAYNGISNRTLLSGTTGSVTDNTWSHVAITFDSLNIKLYINGVETDTASVVAAGIGFTASEPTKLGIRGTSSDPYNGQMDQVRVFNTALTPAQVTQLYNEKPEVDTSNFKAVLYEGTGANQYISNVGFQPDLVWIKNRDQADSHRIHDSIRGVFYLESDTTSNEVNGGTAALKTFESNGFTIGTGNSYNTNNESYVAWGWKAGGTPVTIGVNSITGSTPSIASTVSANPAAGFSIVRNTGTASYSDTIGHGLTQAPEIVIQKPVGANVAWYVLFNVDGTSGWDYAFLNTSAAFAADTPVRFATNSTTINNWGWNNYDMINYCWHSVAGYSKISTYQGDGTNDYSKEITGLGFDPSFVMVKNADYNGSNWDIIDSRRGNEKNLYANEAYAENANSPASYGSGKFITDGFEVARGSVSASSHWNKSGDTYLYMAFK